MNWILWDPEGALLAAMEIFSGKAVVLGDMVVLAGVLLCHLWNKGKTV